MRRMQNKNNSEEERFHGKTRYKVGYQMQAKKCNKYIEIWARNMPWMCSESDEGKGHQIGLKI